MTVTSLNGLLSSSKLSDVSEKHSLHFKNLVEYPVSILWVQKDGEVKRTSLDTKLIY